MELSIRLLELDDPTRSVRRRFFSAVAKGFSALSKIFELSQNLHGIDLAPKFQVKPSEQNAARSKTNNTESASEWAPASADGGEESRRHPQRRRESVILESPLISPRARCACYPDSRGSLLRLRHPARDRSNGDHLHGITVWLCLHWDRLGREDEFGGGQRLHAELYGNRCADLRRLKTDPRIV